MSVWKETFKTEDEGRDLNAAKCINSWWMRPKRTVTCVWFDFGSEMFLALIALLMVCNVKRLSLIVRVNVVLNRTVVVDSDWRFDNLCGSHLQSQSELYHVSWWYYTLLIDLIGQLRRDIIGRLSVKPWCYWLWRLVISNWCVSIRLLSQLNSRLLLVKLSFSRS